MLAQILLSDPYWLEGDAAEPAALESEMEATSGGSHWPPDAQLYLWLDGLLIFRCFMRKSEWVGERERDREKR